LLKLLGNKRLVSTLLFRGSVHGWKFIDFHSRCDNKGSIICLFKIKDGDCIGAYTKGKFSSPYGEKYVEDIESMLINLSSCRHFPTKSTGKQIVCGKDIGPCFGNVELCAYEPFNGEGKCESNAN
jgi:hypothetical protein